ncbi:MAG: hypothetical protein ACRDX9_02535 [Acidimicrobiia bacterium]
MSYFTRAERETEPALDPFDDPVVYLSTYGIEAELVEVIGRLPEAA